jgi:CheY-like chemotaxis protein
VILPPDKAQSVALIVHELATNAAKYGALSGETGRVSLSWRLDKGRLRLSWTESDGPRISKPKSKGFGAKIIEASLNRPRGDDATFLWLPNGLSCDIVLALTPLRDCSSPTDGHRTANSSKGDRRRILVVEDEGLVGALTSELVAEMGYAALGPCVGLDEAMRFVRRNQVDGAILDVNLGGELVFPLARELVNREIPLLFLTGYEKGIVGAGFEVFPVLQKPVAADDLKNLLALMVGPRDGSKAGPAA